MPLACHCAPFGKWRQHEGNGLNLTLTLAPIIALICGILILVVPRMLNYIVAIYLIVVGLLGLTGNGSLHLH